MSTSNEASKKEDTKREVAMEKAGKTLFSAIQKGLSYLRVTPAYIRCLVIP